MEQVVIVGIVKPGIERTRKEWGAEECYFELESGEKIWCERFIPTIRKGWKVEIIGSWSESKKYISAVNVERVVEKLNYKQLELMEFLK
jgi:hypothetical protein